MTWNQWDQIVNNLKMIKFRKENNIGSQITKHYIHVCIYHIIKKGCKNAGLLFQDGVEPNGSPSLDGE